MIVSPAAIGSEWFLNGLAAIEREEARTQRQLSSGYRIQDASDSPAETSELIRLGSTLASLQAVQTNLGRVQAETGTADQAIGNSISLIEKRPNPGGAGRLFDYNGCHPSEPVHPGS